MGANRARDLLMTHLTRPLPDVRLGLAPHPIFGPAVADPDSDVATIPDLDNSDTDTGAYRVILYNDDWHPMDQVVEQVMKACECGKIKAIKITLDAHRKGRAVCYKGGKGKCHNVAKILREIRLQCEVDADD